MIDWNAIELDTPAITSGALRLMNCALCGAEPGQPCLANAASGTTSHRMPKTFAHVYRRMDYVTAHGVPDDLSDLLGPTGDDIGDLLG